LNDLTETAVKIYRQLYPPATPEEAPVVDGSGGSEAGCDVPDPEVSSFSRRLAGLMKASPVVQKAQGNTDTLKVKLYNTSINQDQLKMVE
jgi:hypothetical protein